VPPIHFLWSVRYQLARPVFYGTERDREGLAKASEIAESVPALPRDKASSPSLAFVSAPSCLSIRSCFFLGRLRAQYLVRLQDSLVIRRLSMIPSALSDTHALFLRLTAPSRLTAAFNVTSRKVVQLAAWRSESTLNWFSMSMA